MQKESWKRAPHKGLPSYLKDKKPILGAASSVIKNDFDTLSGLRIWNPYPQPISTQMISEHCELLDIHKTERPSFYKIITTLDLVFRSEYNKKIKAEGKN